jgi:hypothetical protein
MSFAQSSSQLAVVNAAGCVAVCLPDVPPPKRLYRQRCMQCGAQRQLRLIHLVPMTVLRPTPIRLDIVTFYIGPSDSVMSV